MVRDWVVVRDVVGDVVVVLVEVIERVPRAEVVGDRVPTDVVVGDRVIGAVFVDVVVELVERVDVDVRDEEVVAVVVRELVELFVSIVVGLGVRVVPAVRVLVRVERTDFVAREVAVDSLEGKDDFVGIEDKVLVRVAVEVHVGSTRIIASSLSSAKEPRKAPANKIRELVNLISLVLIE